MADPHPPGAVTLSAQGPSLVKAALSRTGGVEERVVRAWRAWLASLATDAEAATAAAHLYAELPVTTREAWLDALAEDAPAIAVPGAALYGPLLAVEGDPARRQRICEQGDISPEPSDRVCRALLGFGAQGSQVAVLVQPLYLDFVRVLVCRFVRGRGFDAVHQAPIVRDGDAPQPGDHLEGAVLRAACPHAVVDEVAHAVVAHRRAGRELPVPLCRSADLFSPRRDATLRARG